jgi:hypothetical protein
MERVAAAGGGVRRRLLSAGEVDEIELEEEEG